MATVDLRLKLTLEHLLDMSGGYVLDFSNATFAAFVQDSIGLAPYSLYEGSKAQVLRQLWTDQPNALIAKLMIDMLEYRRVAEGLGRITASPDPQRAEVDRRLTQEALDQLRSMLETADRLTRDEAAFLAKDFGTLNLTNADIPVDFQSVIADRLEEIETCFNNSAPLAVVLLCGSTLEGLLYQLAKSQPAAFNRAAAAPTRDGKVLRLPEWSLNHLILTARELGLLGEDVVKFASAVREFRNYIHPQQQVSERFRPRRVTAHMARQVLRAAIEDLTARASTSEK